MGIQIELSDTQLDELAERIAERLASHTAPVPDGWLTTRQAAEHLGLSVHGLHRLTAGRQIPFHQERAGARCWFRRSELDAWRGR
jgi:excisionase family DNA binding protein